MGTPAACGVLVWSTDFLSVPYAKGLLTRFSVEAHSTLEASVFFLMSNCIKGNGLWKRHTYFDLHCCASVSLMILFQKG